MIGEAQVALDSLPHEPRLRARLLTLRGRALFELDGAPERAQALFEEALDLDPELAEASLRLGMVLEHLAFYSRACLAYRDSLRLAGERESRASQEARRGLETTCGGVGF
jgi:tetratricopeptide (TPR) repeat protein